MTVDCSHLLERALRASSGPGFFLPFLGAVSELHLFSVQFLLIVSVSYQRLQHGSDPRILDAEQIVDFLC